MKFVRLRVKHVRGIKSAEVDFGPGLNVLFGPNDIGKSSLVAAVRAALLLQSTSAEGQKTLTPWRGDFTPEVDLTFAREPGKLYRVHKAFGAGTRTGARLESSRDGIHFDQEATARQVEDKLRNILEWGIPSPGGKTRQHGLPRTLPAQALLGEQVDVQGILCASLDEDGTDSGRVRLTNALQAFAQDSRFKSVVTEVQQQVDRFFTSKDKSVKGSPFQDAAEEVAALRGRLEELQVRKRTSDATILNLEELRRAVELLGRSRDEAQARLSALESELKTTKARAEANSALELARTALAVLDAKVAKALAKANEVKALERGLVELTTRQEALTQASKEAVATLEQARDAQKEAQSDRAATARELKKAALTQEGAEDETERGRLEASADWLTRPKHARQRWPRTTQTIWPRKHCSTKRYNKPLRRRRRLKTRR